MFNPNQLAAIAATGNTAVVAGPGSGKSTVIVEKIGTILRNVPNAYVCAVTFTRDAADELPTRFARKFPGNDFLNRCRFGTFHSIAIQQLSEAGKLGRLVAPQKQSLYITQAAKSVSTPDETITYEIAKTRIEAAKCALIRTDELLADPVVNTYERMLKRNGETDLFDVIRDSVIGMKEGGIKKVSANSVVVTHLLIDEFQDTDEVQFEWIMEHVKAGIVTMVVGDDDQTIFEWRRALGFKGLLEFIRKANAEKIVLGHNYRCHSEILGYADTLIRNNANNRLEKNLIAANGPGGQVQILKGQEQEDQAYEIAMQIEPYLQPCDDPSGRFLFTVPEGGWSVIARNHVLLHTMEAVLIEKRIKYQRTSSGFWNQFFLTTFLEVLRSIQTGHSSGIDIALQQSGASHDGIEELHRICGQKFHRYLDGHIHEFQNTGKDDHAVFSRFARFSQAWRDQLREGNYALVIRGVGSYIEDTLLSKVKDEEKRKSLRLAQDILISYGEWTIRTKGGDVRAPTLKERIEMVLKPRNKDADGIALHTMHSCKGLEFDSVAVLDVSEGVIPNIERPDDINDRRLLYVAMTRAKKNLFMSYRIGGASKFFSEAGISVHGKQ